MKRQTLFMLVILLASQASADGWRGDRTHHRVFEEIKSEYLQSHSKHNKRQVSYRSQEHKGVNNRHDNKRQSQHNRRGYTDHLPDYLPDNQNSKSGYHPSTNWQTVSAFRGRSGKVVSRQIQVGEKVQALSIEGTKRGMVVRRARAQLGNGRWVRLDGLEGHVTHGERARHRLHNSRFVRRVVLDIAPDRYKRGYAELQIRPAG